MVQIACRGLLFDLDGVLIDSTPAVARVWKQWSIEHGFDPDEVVRRAHGRPSLATVRDYLPRSDHAAENRIVERREIEDLEGVVALPGAQRLLKDLPQEQWTIVTSCTRALAEVRLRAAGLPIPRNMVTSSDVQHGKPHPEPYLKGAKLLGLPPADCLVLEDAPAGIVAGKAAGARVVGLRTLSDDGELEHSGADWIVDDCSAISLIESSNPDHTLTLMIKADAPQTESERARGTEH